MSDDYLWDGSGEPDFESRQLERTLRALRYQHKPLKLPVSRRPNYSYWRPAAAAAVVLLAACILWFELIRSGHNAATPSQAASEAPGAAEPQGAKGQEKQADKAPAVDPYAGLRMASGKRATAGVHNRFRQHARLATYVPLPRNEPSVEAASIRPDWSDPLFQAETARHMEKVQMLLRAFRNMPVPQGEPGESGMALAYERNQSRQLLSKNIFLRREAEARWNLPVTEMLERIEPFLTDIANLQKAPRQDEMLSIKALMRKQEIIAMLQVYSTDDLGEEPINLR